MAYKYRNLVLRKSKIQRKESQMQDGRTFQGRLSLKKKKKGCFDDKEDKLRRHRSIGQPVARWEDIFS
jgi:hypothetical protein